MNRLRILLWGLVALAPAEQAWGCSSGGPNDSGLVCLDAQTGKPIWEFFHSDSGSIHLTWDGQLFYLSNRAQWVNPLRPEASKNDKGRVFAVDPETGEGVEVNYSPVSSGADEKEYVSRYVRTHLGDTVVAATGNARAITVMRGETQEPRFIISTSDYYSHYLIHQQWIVYALSYHESKPPTGPIVVAVNAETGVESWTLKSGLHFKGIGGGEQNLYVAQTESLRALDPATGEERWVQRLPRIRGWAKVIEHDGGVYVICDQDGQGSERDFVYCLDAVDGRVRWSFDPGGGSYTSLHFYKDRVITRIRPTNWIASWRGTIGGMLLLTPDTSGGSPSAGADRFAERMGGKTAPDIELTMRAWHALGDRSALTLLEYCAKHLDEPALQELAVELQRTFPRARDRHALLAFLEETYERDKTLRPEVAQIVRDIEPMWTYLQREAKRGRSSYGLPPLEPTQSEKEWKAAYEGLRNKVLRTSITRLTREGLAEMITGEAYADLDFLTGHYAASQDADEKLLLRIAIVKVHPVEGSEWALANQAEYGEMEIGQWAQVASSDWLIAHEEIFYSWLVSADSFLQGNAARQLMKVTDAERAAFLASRLLRESGTRAFSGGWDSRSAALKILAGSGDVRHIPLIKEFYFGSASAPDGAKPRDDLHPILRQDAEKALIALGVRAGPVPKPKLEQNCPDSASSYDQIRRLDRELYFAQRRGDAAAVTIAATDAIALMPEDELNAYDRERLLADAYEALGMWDEAIRQRAALFVNSPDHIDRDLLPLLAKAGRIEEMEQMISAARPGDEVIVQGAHLFIELERYDRAEELLRAALAGDANDAGACIGLALVMAQREEFAEADAMMERAIALRPHPSFCDSFGHTITYWLKRGKPERAIAWMTTAVAEDRGTWERDRLFEWAEHFAELKEAAGKLRAEGAGAGSLGR